MGYYDAQGYYHEDNADSSTPQFRNDAGVGQYNGTQGSGALGMTPYTGTNAAQDITKGPANIGRTERINGPIAGYDNRDLTHLLDPNAFEYGGHAGGAQEAVDQYRGLAGAADARGPIQANLGTFNADWGRAAANEANQGYLASRYAGILNGSVTTPAQTQLAQGQSAGLAQIGSRVASARGGGSALASAQAAGSDAGAATTGAYQGALRQLQAREQMGAIQGLGQVASQQREQDMQRTGMLGQNAYQQAALAGQSQGLNDQRNINYEGMAGQVYQDQTKNQQEAERANQGWIDGARKQAMDNDARNDATNAKVYGGMASLGGAILALSDVRAKTDIQPAGRQVDQMMGAMSPYGYRYKQPERHGQGEQVGPMAQDLAATPAGRTAVVPTKEGLAIDGKQATKLSLAGIARLDERLRKLEGGGPVQDRTPEELDEYAAAQQRLRAGPVRDADLRYVAAYEQPGRVQDVDVDPAAAGIAVMPKQAPQGLVAVAPPPAPVHTNGEVLMGKLAGYKDQLVGGIQGAARRGLAALGR